MSRPLFSTLLLTAVVMASAAFPAGSTAAPAPASAASVVRPSLQEVRERATREPVAQESAAQHAAEEEHADEDAHAWGTETMMHHIVDSKPGEPIEFFAWQIPLPKWEPVRAGPLVIDMSPTKHTVFLWIATLLTILTVWVAARRFSREVALANIGRGGERFVPYVVTLFFFILYANLLGLVPYGATATSNIMVTAALAVISLVIVEAAGFVALGPKGYLGTIFYVPKGLPKPMVPVMLIIMTPVEIIGKLAKPFALAVRLFANMTAGHFVILALLGLILTYGGANLIGGVSIVGVLALGLFVMFLEIFVAFLQAYIFTILTAVFIGLIRHAH
jgi:F-type H+-transporting ATPase subunit a